MHRDMRLVGMVIAILAVGCSRTEPKVPRIPIVSIQIDPAEPSVALGTRALVTAQGIKADGTTTDLSECEWSVADESLVTLEPEGGTVWISGVKLGETLLRASARGMVAEATLRVRSPMVSRLEISPSETSVAIGGVAQLAAVTRMSDGSTEDVTVRARWSSASPEVATVGDEGAEKGQVHGVGAGKAQVTATFDGLEASAAVTVSGATLVRLDVMPPSATLPLHTALPLSAIALFSDSTTSDVTALAEWTSSDASRVRVDGAMAEAVGPGRATVTARYGGREARSEILVTTAELKAVEVAPPQAQIAKGTSTALQATAIFADDTRQDVTFQANWVSSRPEIAAVGETVRGVVRGVSPGVAVVSAELLGVTGSAQITVTDARLVALVVTPTTLTLAKGARSTFVATGTYTDQSTQDVSALALWTSSDEAVATVSNAPGSKGEALAKEPGVTTLQATLDGLTANATLTVTAAEISSIAIDPPAASIAKGTEVQLTATATFTDGSTLLVTAQAAWSSSNNALASVATTGDARGLVRGLAPGLATITAAFGGKTGSAQVTVTPATLMRLTIAPLEPSIAKGGELRMQAMGTYSDGHSQDVTALVTWSVGDAAIAHVSNASGSSGNVTGLAAGTTTLRATLEGESAQTTLTVTPALLVGLRVSPTSMILEHRGSQQATATAYYSDGSAVDVTAQADWTSADPAIASVGSTGTSRGLVSAGVAGQTSVNVSFGGRGASLSVTVRAPAITTIEIRPPTLSLPAGSRGQLNAWAHYADGSTQDVSARASWSSSTAHAVVGSGATGGQLTARSVGNATISATLDGASGTALVTVTEPLIESLTISPTNATIAVGARQAFTVRAFFSDGSSLDATSQSSFSSADTAIVGLDESSALGVAQGGPVAVTARYGGMSAVARVTVTPAALASLVITPNGLVLARGETGQLRALGIYSDGSSRDVTADVAWSSSNLSVCSVAAGLVRALGPGSATITASMPGASATASVRVEAPQLQRIAVVPPNAVLRPNLIYPYRSYAVFSDGSSREVTTAATWTSDNPSIAEPINYQGYWGIWAKGAGTAEARSSYDGQTGRTLVQVFNSTLTGVEVGPAQLELPVGVAAKLSGVFSYSDGWATEIQNPEWSSEQSAIARVDTNGVATAVAQGSTRIQMLAYDSWGGVYQASAAVQVTSATIQRIELEVPSRLVVGLAARAKATGVFSDGSRIDLGLSAVWSSSDTSLASVVPDTRGAEVNARAAGSVTIGASFGGVSARVPVTIASTALSTLSLTLGSSTLPVGATASVRVEGVFADGTRLDLTESADFESSAPDIAQITNGIFGNSLQPHAIGQLPGTATLRASLNGKSGSQTVTVRGATLASLALAAGTSAPSSTLTLSGPGPHSLRAVGTFSDGSSADVTVFCTFSPGELGPGVVATISNVVAGQVTVISTGTETVTATYAPSFIGQPTVRGSATLIVR